MTTREMFNQFTSFDPNTFNGCGIVKEGDYRTYDSIIYFAYIRLRGCMFLIYVGQTQRGQQRIQEHKFQENMPIDRWFYIPVPSSMLDEVERYYIQTYRPILNLIDNPDFIKEDGHYIGNTALLHDIKMTRIALLNAIKEREEQTGHSATDLFHMWTDEEMSHLSHFKISPDITRCFHGGR